jgi:hypothetical protein
MVRQTSLLEQTSQREPQQYQRFLEAADRFGPHLESLFRKGFVQIVSSSRDELAQVGVHGEPAVNPVAPARPQHATPSNWQNTLPRGPSDTPEADQAVDVSIIARLHFVEAMMVLLFNASDEKQPSPFEQAFGRLSKQLGDIGRPAEALRAYRDALSAVQKMLASNPEPGEIAVALRGDFAKRFRNT